MTASLIPLHQKIKEICAEKINVSVSDSIDETLSIDQAYDIDSLAVFEILANLERHYNCRIPDEDLQSAGKKNLVGLKEYFESLALNSHANA